MAVFKEWPGIRYIMQLIIMNLVSCLACLSAIAFAQLEFSEAVTGSVSFPDGVIAFIGNLAVFFTCLIRGRLDLENGARDFLATNRGPKLRKIGGSGLTTCNIQKPYESAQVVMLSKHPSNSNSISQFMKYAHHSYGVDSILLECLDLQSVKSKVVMPDLSEVVTPELCGCSHDSGCSPRDPVCRCVVLWTVEEKIASIIARRMPGTLKWLSDSVCLLPCSICLKIGCHGCDQGMLHVKQIKKDSNVERPKCIRLQSAGVNAEPCYDQLHECMCNVLRTEEEQIGMMVDHWKRGTVKQLSNSLCLLPSWDCFRRGCHGLLQTEEDSNSEPLEIHQEPEPEQVLREEESMSVEIEQQYDAEKTEPKPERALTEEGFKAESPAAVCQMLGKYWIFGRYPGCICIPLCEGRDDRWTKLMIRFLRSKDKVSREVIVGASDAMQKYIDGSGEIWQAKEKYSRWSLIVPRLIEVSLNIVLVGWLRVDGLSSSLIARRVVRDHLVDSKGTGFNANAFLTSARIQCNQSSVCQVLWFRGKIVGVTTLSCIAGCVNLICAMSWCVLMACNGRYGIHSMPPSKPRIVVMLASIGVALLMDFVDLIFAYLSSRKRVMVLAVIILEIGYIVSGSVIVAKGMGIGKWVYSVFQALIWVKWGIGSYLLGDRDDRVDSERHRINFYGCFGSSSEYSDRIMMYSSVFMLNAILAGVRGKWEY